MSREIEPLSPTGRTADPTLLQCLPKPVIHELLLGGEEPVTRIAEQAGFATLQQFNLVFRRLVGCTPSAYRNRLNG